MNFNLATYLKEVKMELGKVVWPKKQEIVKLTSIVILISAIVALYLGTLDVGFTKLLETLLTYNI